MSASVAKWSSCWRSGTRRALLSCDRRSLFRHGSTDGQRLVQLQIRLDRSLPNPPEHSPSFARSLAIDCAPERKLYPSTTSHRAVFLSNSGRSAAVSISRGQHQPELLRRCFLFLWDRGEPLMLLRCSIRALLKRSGRCLSDRGGRPPCPWSRRLG